MNLKQIKAEIMTTEKKLETLHKQYDAAYARHVTQSKNRAALLTIDQAVLAFGKTRGRMSNMFSQDLKKYRVKNSDGKAAVPYGAIEDYYADTYARQTVSPATRKAALVLHEQGLKQDEIAQKLDISRSTVQRIEREAGAARYRKDA